MKVIIEVQKTSNRYKHGRDHFYIVLWGEEKILEGWWKSRRKQFSIIEDEKKSDECLDFEIGAYA